MLMNIYEYANSWPQNYTALEAIILHLYAYFEVDAQYCFWDTVEGEHSAKEDNPFIQRHNGDVCDKM